MATLLVLGVLAGGLTTVAGLGGGVLLVAALSALRGPVEALAVTAPALLVGNAHRWWLFRRATAWPVFRRLVEGLVPGALVASFVTVAAPEWLVAGILVGVTLVAVVQALVRAAPRLPLGWITPGGVVVGALAGSGGGAAFLMAPLVITAGLTGEAFLATTAGASFLLHASRLVGYGAGGLLGAATLLDSGVLAAAVLVGNALGRRVRGLLTAGATRGLELGALLVASAASLAALAR